MSQFLQYLSGKAWFGCDVIFFHFNRIVASRDQFWEAKLIKRPLILRTFLLSCLPQIKMNFKTIFFSTAIIIKLVFGQWVARTLTLRKTNQTCLRFERVIRCWIKIKQKCDLPNKKSFVFSLHNLDWVLVNLRDCIAFVSQKLPY
jgi:hypothetical protein